MRSGWYKSMMLVAFLFGSLLVVSCDDDSTDNNPAINGGNGGGQVAESSMSAEIDGRTFNADDVFYLKLGQAISINGTETVGTEDDNRIYQVQLQLNGVSSAGTYKNKIISEGFVAFTYLEQITVDGETSDRDIWITQESEVVITSFAEEKISGTFSATLFNLDGDNLSVVNGKFETK